jgi:hypothetical protein
MCNTQRNGCIAMDRCRGLRLSKWGSVLGKVRDMGCFRYNPDLPYCNRPWPTARFLYQLPRMGEITLGNFGNIQNPLILGGGGNVTVALIVNSSRCGKRSFTWYSLKLVSSVQRMLISSLAADTSLWVVLYSCIELRQGMPWCNFLYVVETLPSMMLTESRSEQERSVIWPAKRREVMLKIGSAV